AAMRSSRARIDVAVACLRPPGRERAPYPERRRRVTEVPHGTARPASRLIAHPRCVRRQSARPAGDIVALVSDAQPHRLRGPRDPRRPGASARLPRARGNLGPDLGMDADRAFAPLGWFNAEHTHCMADLRLWTVFRA